MADDTVKAVNGSEFHVNGVHKNGLKILIVGAGVGGLTAAIALRQQGHEVLVRFKNRFFLYNLKLTVL